MATKQKREKKCDISFGKRLKELRRTKVHPKFHELEDDRIGYTRDDLAAMLHVSTETIKNWEQGYNYPHVEDLKRIADVFGCDTDYLLGRRDSLCSSLCTSNETLENLIHLPDDHRIKHLLGHLLADHVLLDDLAAICTHDYDRITFYGVQPFEGSKERLDIGFRDKAKAETVNVIQSLIIFINECRRKNGLDPLDRLF